MEEKKVIWHYNIYGAEEENYGKTFCGKNSDNLTSVLGFVTCKECIKSMHEKLCIDSNLVFTTLDLLKALEDMFSCIGKNGYFPQCGKTISDNARTSIDKAKKEIHKLSVLKG